MTFKEAFEAVKKLAAEEYFRIGYSLTEHHDGKQSEECVVYIHGHGRYESSTWEESISRMECDLTGKKYNTDQAPE